ncbi:unnamed protein product [Acanthoscelides obtectus]|uniref:Uncharacterized protein n=1 Tax=Acanthoscelides obtectus TaxID=200917 RepID=A0A9P0LGJ2_ACAOB|nr:unnamed protein product [Acanthoscelides obtectus]CAK1645832.1 hypothetical protein AOBTE_LOCUS14300 [Acanthoscelides obtectus]
MVTFCFTLNAKIETLIKLYGKVIQTSCSNQRKIKFLHCVTKNIFLFGSCNSTEKFQIIQTKKISVLLVIKCTGIGGIYLRKQKINITRLVFLNRVTKTKATSNTVAELTGSKKRERSINNTDTINLNTLPNEPIYQKCAIEHRQENLINFSKTR